MGTPENEPKPAETQGPPALQAGGLRLWVHGRQFPSAHDADEGNRLRATVRCEAQGSSVRAEEAIITAGDLDRWAQECSTLPHKPISHARLSVQEGSLEIVLDEAAGLGRLRMSLPTPPADGAQALDFDLDGSEMTGIVEQCEQILRAYPVRGAMASPPR